MWDQKTNKNVSVQEGSTQNIGGAITTSQRDKKQIEFESGGEDSGFLSGPQNLYSSEIDELTDKSVNRDKELESYTDSGAIDSDFIEEDSIAKDLKQSHMLLDSGVDLGLTEWFCELNLKNSTQPLNNLGNCKKTTTLDEQKHAKLAKKLLQRPLWEICYIQDDDGDTQLHLAIIGKYVQAIWAIIRLAPVPAVLDIRNDNAEAPLHLAVLTGQPNVVRRLLVAGAKASIRDRHGNTALHLACMNSDKACVEALTLPIREEELQDVYKYTKRIPQINHFSPDLEQRNYDGEYCVHLAAQANNIDILRHLVWLGADINAREGKSGYTALHFACENNNEELVQFLLNECNQLNVEACTYGQQTAYQLAASLKNKDLMCNLEHFGAELLTPPQSDDDDDYSDGFDNE